MPEFESRSPSDHLNPNVAGDISLTTENTTGLNRLKSMDESYHKLRAAFVDQTSRVQEISNREKQLLDRIEELERMLAVSREKHAAESEKACTAANEARNWRTQYEGLRDTLQGALGQHA